MTTAHFINQTVSTNIEKNEGSGTSCLAVELGTAETENELINGEGVTEAEERISPLTHPLSSHRVKLL